MELNHQWGFSWTGFKKKVEKAVRMLQSAAIGFWEDDCYTKASTLTFYTLQSIVPFLAAILAIAKGFGFDDYLEKLITTAFFEQKEIFNYAIAFALSLLKSITSGSIVGIGVILLLWTNINLVGYIELALNDIWKVKKSRGFFQKLKDFSFAVVVFPLIFVASSSATVYFQSHIHELQYFKTVNEYLLHGLTTMLPWILSCFLFGALYFLIPNARLKVGPRLIASLVAGTAFQVWQVIFINFQLYIFSYNIVYGAVALLPLFLIWLQLSWMIALAGAEIAAHIENYKYFIKDLKNSAFTKTSRCELALIIVFECMKTFYSGKKPLSLVKLSDRLKISQDVLEEILTALEEGNILVSFMNKEQEVCYHPLYDPSKLKILTICDAIDHNFDNTVILETSEVLVRIQEAIKKIHQTSETSEVNLPICDFFNLK